VQDIIDYLSILLNCCICHL